MRRKKSTKTRRISWTQLKMTLCAIGLAPGFANAHSTAHDGQTDLVEALYQIPISESLRLKGILAGLDILGRSESGRSLIIKGTPGVLAAISDLGRSPNTFHVHNFEVPQNTEGYIQPDELNSRLTAIVRENPKYFRLEEIGRSRENRPILAVVIGSSLSKEKPAVFFNGMHHARELMTTEVTLSIIESFAAAAKDPGSDPELRAWLDDYRIIVAPQMNPDGNSLVHNGRRLWRKNAWRDQNNIVGVDLNRNYPTGWGSCSGSSGNKNSDTYRGPEPASEPESRALMNLVAEHEPNLAISYHSFSEMIIFPYGCRNVENPSRELFANLANVMNQEIINDRGEKGAYATGTAPELLYNADGSDIDWQWESHGVLAYTIELNSSRQGFQPDYATWSKITQDNQAGGWKSLIRRLEGPRIYARLAPESVKNLTGSLSYTITVLNDKGEAIAFAPSRLGGNQKFKVSSDRGGSFIHRILEPGVYRIEFFSGALSVGIRDFELGNSPLDLGELTF